MSKPFDQITEAGFELLRKMLEQPNSAPGDFMFDEPTVDGNTELLLSSNLAVLDSNGQLSITELGRAALKHHDYVKEQEYSKQTQFTEGLAAIKLISESASRQADSAKDSAESAKTLAQTAQEDSKSSTKYSRISIGLSILALIISIAAIVVPLLCG